MNCSFLILVIPTTEKSELCEKIGSYSKGLPHNAEKEDELPAYGSTIAALHSGYPLHFLLFLDLERTDRILKRALLSKWKAPDSYGSTQPPAPSFSSAEDAGQIAENYWHGAFARYSFCEL